MPGLSFPPSRLPDELVPTDAARQASARQLLWAVAAGVRGPFRCLDFGCADESLKDEAARLAPHLRWIGVDVPWSPEVAQRPSRRTATAFFDGDRLPLASESIDIVYSRQVLEHVRRPGPVLRELRRVAKPGCTFVGSVSQIEPYHSYSRWNWTPFALASELAESGWRLLQVRPGIDGISLSIRSIALRGWLSRYFEVESPVNRAIDFVGRLKGWSPGTRNRVKLQIAGHICFIAVPEC